MNIEKLQQRASDIQKSISSLTNQVLILQGHKDEIDYQISLLTDDDKKEVIAGEEETNVE